MSLARQCADRLMGGAERLIPPAKSDWARAMAAEQAAVADDRDALAFSAGCLRAAGFERLRAMAPDAAWFWPGSAFGILFLATALIPGSGSLPLLWAPLGGIATVLMLDHAPRSATFGGAVALAFKTGALAGALFFGGVLLLGLAAGAGPAGEQIVRIAVAGAALALVTTISGTAAAPLVSQPPWAGAQSSRKER